MIELYEKNPAKRREGVVLANLITRRLNRGKKRQYPKAKVEGFRRLLDEPGIADDAERVVAYIFDNGISLKEVVSVNYRQVQAIYEENGRSLDHIRGFEEFEILCGELSALIRGKRDFMLGYLGSIYQNSSRRKGGLFRSIVSEDIFERADRQDADFVSRELCGGMPLYVSLHDALRDDASDFVYIPESDVNALLLLEGFGVQYPGGAKGRDVVVRYKGVYFVGEAKEIHEAGGHQNNQFRDMESCVADTDIGGGVVGFGILYGASLMYGNPYQRGLDSNPSIVPLSEFVFNLPAFLDGLLQEAVHE